MGKGFGCFAGLSFDHAQGLKGEAVFLGLPAVATCLPCFAPVFGQLFELLFRGGEVVALERVLKWVRRPGWAHAASEADAQENPAERERHADEVTRVGGSAP